MLRGGAGVVFPSMEGGGDETGSVRARLVGLLVATGVPQSEQNRARSPSSDPHDRQRRGSDVMGTKAWQIDRVRRKGRASWYPSVMVILPVLERVTRAVLVRRGVESRYVETGGVRVHLYDARGDGDLPPVVMLHGIGASASPFAPILARLRKKSRRVLAVDAPGHGFSETPKGSLGIDRFRDALIAVLDRELSEPALVVGNSLGGAMALHYAIARKARVAGLVLTSPGGAPVEDPHERERFLSGFSVKNLRDARAFLDRLHHEVPWYGPLVAADLVRIFNKAAVRGILDSIEPGHFFAPGDFDGLTMPIHVLWGKSDRIIPASCLAFFKKNLPAHAVFEEPEGIGHSPHLEDPKAFLKLVMNALEQAGSRAQS